MARLDVSSASITRGEDERANEPCPASCPSSARCGRLVVEIGLDLCDAWSVPPRALATWPVTPASRSIPAFRPYRNRWRTFTQKDAITRNRAS